MLGEVDAADDETDEGRQDVLDEAVHDGGKGDPDDDADGEVDHIAAHE
jgi:hypothetical protein